MTTLLPMRFADQPLLWTVDLTCALRTDVLFDAPQPIERLLT